MLLHSLQWIRHKFNEVITDPSCEFMLTVCSQSHGPSTVNSRQSFQPGLPANKPVTGRLGAATLGHRRQTITLLGFLLVFPSVCPYGASPPCLSFPTAEPPSPGLSNPVPCFSTSPELSHQGCGKPRWDPGGWRARGWDGSCSQNAAGGGTGWKRSPPPLLCRAGMQSQEGTCMGGSLHCGGEKG